MKEAIDLGDLVRRLKDGGRLSESEREYVLKRVGNIANDKDVHNLARIFALSEPPTPENVRLISSMLSSTLNDYDLWGVILALCSYWGLTEHFAPQLMSLLTLPACGRNFVQSAGAALTELGILTFKTRSSELLSRLLGLYDDANLPNDLLSERQRENLIASTHMAIEIALNGPSASVNYINFRVPDDVNDDLIEQARRLAKSGKYFAKVL